MFSGAALAASETFPVTFSAPAGVANSMTISDASGSGETNYPLQFGRPFVEGAIPHAPTILVNGTAVASQADVKNRYPDGSVEFAVMAAVIPTIPASGSVALTFADTTTPNNTPLTTTQMEAVPNFDAAMKMSFGARLVSPVLSAAFPAVTNGGFAVTVNGTVYQVTGINIPAGSYSGAVLPIVQAAVAASGAPVVFYGPLPVGASYRQFVIQTKATGPAATISYATAPASGTDLSMMLGLTSAAATANSVLTGSNASADLLTMLNAGACHPWTSGPVAQTMVCADDTTAAAYDVGDGDGNKPLRPRFYATFWPATGQVFVRAVGENGKSTQLEDLAYNLTVTAGISSPATVSAEDLNFDQGGSYPKEDWALSSWSRTFWFGSTPNPEVNIDNNLAYLESTRFIPTYDLANDPLPAATVTTEYALYTNSAHDIYDGTSDGGVWENGMGDTGARQEIGPAPTWDVMWLDGGDWRMRQTALGLTDLAGAYPANLRETATGKRLLRSDPAGSSGLGHVVSITDRKTLDTDTLGLLAYNDTAPSDAVTFVGPVDLNQDFTFDDAHLPAPFFIPYVLTGDPWYLNEDLLWAGFEAAATNGAAKNTNQGRGPTGDEGGIDGQGRALAWGGLNRAEAAFMAPDVAPEKTYFTYLMNDALARWEGGDGITGTAYDGTPEKVWSISVGFPDIPGGTAPPLGNYEYECTSVSDCEPQSGEQETAGIFNTQPVAYFESPWMEWYLLYSLGREQELGFASGALLAKTAPYLTGLIAAGYGQGVNIYWMSLGAADGTPFTSWSQIMSAYTTAYLSTTAGAPSPNLYTDFTGDLYIEGYPAYAQAAGSYLTSQPNGPAAWTWLNANVRLATPFNTGPKWDLVPSTSPNTLPAQGTATPPS